MSRLPGRPFSLLIQQLFQGPPPDPWSVRSLMESAGSKLTHEKRANKSLQLLVSAPGWLALPGELLSPRPTFHVSPGEAHCLLHGYWGAQGLHWNLSSPAQSYGLRRWKGHLPVLLCFVHYSYFWIWDGLTTCCSRGWEKRGRWRKQLCS